MGALELGNGLRAHFFIFRLMYRHSTELKELARGVVEPMGYELVGVEYLNGYQGGNLLRVYIDSEHGIRLQDCARVSHQLSGVLDVEDLIQGKYNLEVSSPGMDRPLFDKVHFERFAGCQVNIRLASEIDNRRRYRGLLKGIEDDSVLVEMGDELFSLPLGNISEARLVPDF